MRVTRASSIDTRIILRVAVSAPLPGLFDYLPAIDSSEGAPAPGMRVLAPFGRSRRMGMIVELASTTEQHPERLKRVEALLDEAPLIGASDLQFILWAASYYQHPPGEALFSTLPVRLRRVSTPLESGESGWRLTPQGCAGVAGAIRGPKQAQVARMLLEHAVGLTDVELRRRFGDCRATLRALAARGWVEPCQITSAPQTRSDGLAKSGPDLSSHQERAVESVLKALGTFHAFLLEGVTGSGKTEVYIRLLQRLLADGRQALVLVPEIGLTPQLLRRLSDRISAPMVTLHSALTDREREREWRDAPARP